MEKSAKYMETAIELCGEENHLLYLVQSGSRFHGCFNEEDNFNFSGVYLPNLKSMLAGVVPQILSNNSNRSTRLEPRINDILLIPVQKYLENVMKGDIQSIETAFTCDRSDQIEPLFSETLHNLRCPLNVRKMIKLGKGYKIQFETSLMKDRDGEQGIPENTKVNVYHGMRLLHESLMLLKDGALKFPFAESHMLHDIRKWVDDDSVMPEDNVTMLYNNLLDIAEDMVKHATCSNLHCSKCKFGGSKERYLQIDLRGDIYKLYHKR